MNVETANRLVQLRKKRGYSQEELAEKIGISTTHMSHIETGNTKLSLQVLVDLSLALEVKTDELLFDSAPSDKGDCASEIAGLIAADGGDRHVGCLFAGNGELIGDEIVRQLVVVDGIGIHGFAVFARQNARLCRAILCDRVGHLQRNVALIAEGHGEGDRFAIDIRCNEDGVRCAALRGLELIAALFRVQGRAVNRCGENLRIICAFAFQGKAII